MLLCELKGRASLSPRQPAQHLYGCLLQHAFSLCFLRFLDILACISCNPFVSMMNLHSSWEVLEEGRTWRDIRKSYSRQGGTYPAVSLKGHHSVNLARPCHKFWFASKCQIVLHLRAQSVVDLLPPLTACKGVCFTWHPFRITGWVPNWEEAKSYPFFSLAIWFFCIPERNAWI